MKIVMIALTFLSTVAFAETTTLTVEGMHCSGCKHGISKNVCDNESIKATTEKCEVKLTNLKKQTGTVTLTAKKDQKVDIAEVKKMITTAGEEFKVTKEQTK